MHGLGQTIAIIHNYGNIFAVIFFLPRALSMDRIYRILGILFAYGEIPKGRRPFYLNNPVNPV